MRRRRSGVSYSEEEWAEREPRAESQPGSRKSMSKIRRGCASWPSLRGFLWVLFTWERTRRSSGSAGRSRKRERSNVRSPTTSLPFPFPLLPPTSCSTGKEDGITLPFKNWAYNPLLAASRLAALMAVRLRADPAPNDVAVGGVEEVEVVEEVDC